MTQAITSPAPARARLHGERAPLLAFWTGDLASLVAAMLAARPALGARLVLAPPEALHAAAAFLQHRGAEGDDGADAAALAAVVATRRARDLLREVMPGFHPRLYRALAKCGPRAHTLSTYTAINAILHGPLGHALLRRHLITQGTVETVLRLGADPVLAACGEAVMADPGHLAYLEAALLLLRGHGLARDIEEVPEGAGWRAVAARVASDLGRAECPVVPFNVPPGWCQPRRWSEVVATGRAMKNCLALPLASVGYVEPWLAGRLVILRAEGGGGLATLQAAGGGVWSISEVVLHEPRDFFARHKAEQALRESLAIAVEAGGGRLAEADPWACMGALLDGPNG